MQFIALTMKTYEKDQVYINTDKIVYVMPLPVGSVIVINDRSMEVLETPKEIFAKILKYTEFRRFTKEEVC